MFKIIKTLVFRENKRIQESKIGRGNSVLFGNDELIDLTEDLKKDIEKIDTLLMLHQSDMEIINAIGDALTDIDERLRKIEDILKIKRNFEIREY